jgi:MraZ protein
MKVGKKSPFIPFPGKSANVFRGVHHLSIDAKGRLAMPARQRERLQSLCDGELVATIDTQSRCLLLYPLPVWEELQTQIQQLPTLDPVVRRFQRLLIGYASDLECDASGRMLVPPALRDYARLDKRAVLVGQGHKMELWDEDTWLAERDKWLELAAGDGAMPEEMRRLAL